MRDRSAIFYRPRAGGSVCRAVSPASRAFAVALSTLAAAGCLAPSGDTAEDRAARILKESLGAAPTERGAARNARWYLVRGWAAAPGSPPAELAPARVESLASDVLAAGLVAVLDEPPQGDSGRAILLRDGQTGFVAVWRGEPCAPFEVAGRPLGGDDTPVDRGFEVAPAVRADGLELELAPLFRGLGEGGGDLRVGSLAFTVRLAPGETLRLLVGPEPPGAPQAPGHSEIEPGLRRSAVLKALFSGRGGQRRELWLRAEVFR